ncbi:MAG: XrtA system polysaccharide chain length determinant [Thiomonas sp.]|jgi:polysaccharide chain length determinant protein (PEP-CTERM system associated)
MNDLLRPLFNLLPGMWDRRWVGLITAWVVLVLGGVGVALFHERYMASARVFVDTQTLLKPLMQGLTVQPNIDEQVQMVARTLLSRPNLERLVRENKLAPDDGRPDAMNRAVDQLYKSLKLDINARENLYGVSYANPDPRVALNVVRDLVNMFLTSGIGGKQQDTRQALQFLDAQVADYARQLNAAEQKLKDFKTAHPGYAGPANIDYYTRVNQASDQLSQLQGQLSAAIAARNAIVGQMRSEPPTITVTSPYPGAAAVTPSGQTIPADVLDIERQIQTQRNRLDELLQRYTNEYPDVIATRQTLARLEAEKKARLKAAAEQPAAAAPAAPPNLLSTANPAYQQLRVQVAQADANVASLQAQVAEAQARLNQLRSQAGQMPALDQQYASLMRGYDIIRKSYDDLVARRQAAGLTQSVDATSQLAVFRVVDPPRVEQHPLFPSKPMLIAMLVFFALACGVAASFVVSQLMPTFHSPRHLRESIDRPVLGSISLLNLPDVLAQDRKDNLYLALGIAGIVAIGLLWAVWAHFSRMGV